MKKEKGFTLVELLAVVVVLGITLVIAVSKISNTMETAREKALSSSAKKIALGAENEYLERKTYGDVAFLNAETIPCDEFVNNTSEYENCEVSFTKGRAFVKLEGKGKFDGKYICVGTKEEARVQSEVCNLVTMAEEKLIIAAKDYAKYVDVSFNERLKNVGDKNYIYKTDLLKEELISEVEVSRLDTFSGVKGQLLDNQKVDYSIEYINADPNEYTIEELYTMFQSLNDKVNNMGNTGGTGGSIDSSIIDDLQQQINSIKSKTDSNTTAIQNNEALINTNKTSIQNNETLIYTNTSLINQYSTNMSNLTNKSNSNNVFLKTYPVGSIYVSTSSTNPGNTFGGTWVSFGTGRTLVGVDTSQTEFNAVEKTGGEKTHALIKGELPYIYGTWAVPVVNEHSETGVTGSAYGVAFGTIGSTNEFGITYGNTGTIVSSGMQYGYGFKFGNDQPHNNLQPYITVYMWKRTA